MLDQEDLPAGASLDPAKLTLHVPAGGMPSVRSLAVKHGIQAEAAGLDWLTLLVTPFHDDAELGRLAKALAAEIGPRAEARTANWPPWPRGLPTRVYWPREAVLAPRIRLPIAECGGRVAAAPAKSISPRNSFGLAG